jgi:GSCFA family
MPQLQTLVNVPAPDFSVNYNHNIFLLGSCFATNIGERLEKLKFRSITNPFGVIYNPASIAQSLELLISDKIFAENDLDYYNDLWFSFYHHTSFSSVSKSKCLENINSVLINVSHKFPKADVLFLTLGTSWIFRNKASGRVVANCHKIPSKEFVREFLNYDESLAMLTQQFDKLFKLNGNIKIILTISPIRHWKDGATENMRSKAALVLAVKELEKKYNNVFYFPVYEIFMDEMRDYRYYASDMIHPSAFAVDYIWERFSHTFFTSLTQNQTGEIEKFLTMLEHRPLNSETANHKKFLKKLDVTLIGLEKKFPEIDFSCERKLLQERIS